MTTRAQSIPSTETFARLWQHECTRVFCDRLSDEADRNFFKETTSDLLKSKLKASVKEESIFSVLLRLEQETVLYEEVSDRQKLLKVLEDKLSDCNLSS